MISAGYTPGNLNRKALSTRPEGGLWLKPLLLLFEETGEFPLTFHFLQIEAGLVGNTNNI